MSTVKDECQNQDSSLVAETAHTTVGERVDRVDGVEAVAGSGTVESDESKFQQRISELEEALDQSLRLVEELQGQMEHQQFLEAQLAQTEQFSNIQQMAIVELKRQLAQQQREVKAQSEDSQVQQQTVQVLLQETEAIASAQQMELEHLRTQLNHDRAEAKALRQQLEKQLLERQTLLDSQQQLILELETALLTGRTETASLEAQRNESQSHVKLLQHQLLEAQTWADSLEAKIAQLEMELQGQDELVEQLDQSQDKLAQQTEVITTLNEDLEMATHKLESLETQVARQATAQARLQQSYQELESERDQYQERTQSLEQQQAEMQEQILKQARQAHEYETAVQHWQARCLNAQDDAYRLDELVQSLLRELGSGEGPLQVSSETLQALQMGLTQLITTLEPSVNREVIGSHTLPSAKPLQTVAAPTSQPFKVDLPTFLARRRTSESGAV